MTNTVLIKRSSVANSVPLTGNLQPGELAINYNDGNLFYKSASNVVTVIASNKFVSVSGNVTGGNIITSGAVSTSGIVSTGTVDFVSSGNISLGNVGNIHISGGTSGYVLSTNGSGNLSWVAQGAGSAVAGSNTQVQFNTNGNFDASAAFTFDKISNTLSTGGLTGSRSNTTITTSTTIDTFSTGTFRGAKYLIQGGDGTDYQAADVLLIHDTTNAYITVSTVCSNATSDVFSVAATVTGGNVVLSATKISSGNTVVNLTATYVNN